MKRLYVQPAYRNSGAGALLVSAVIAAAQQAGYNKMLLDTLKPMRSAITLYKKFGFAETEPYYHNPMPDVIYMALNLRSAEV